MYFRNYLCVQLFLVLVFAQRKIYNGTAISTKTIPYIVRVFILSSSNGKLVTCTGIYVHPHWILTAAHCVSEVTKGTKVKCCMGSSHATYNCQQHRYVEHIVLPHNTELHDFAMLNIHRPFDTGEAIQTGRLQWRPLDMATLANKYCSAAGWGLIGAGRATNLLHVARVMVMVGCFSDNMICVFMEREGPCQGDSGGPLVCNDTVVGVLSAGTASICGRPNVIAVYTRVDLHTKFLYGVMNGEYGTAEPLLPACWLVIGAVLLSIIKTYGFEVSTLISH